MPNRQKWKKERKNHDDYTGKWHNIEGPSKWHVTPETARILQLWHHHHKFSGIRPFFGQLKEAIQDKELYDLKAIPTNYLMDGGKTVLLWDPTFELFEKYLNSL